MVQPPHARENPAALYESRSTGKDPICFENSAFYNFAMAVAYSTYRYSLCNFQLLMYFNMHTSSRVRCTCQRLGFKLVTSGYLLPCHFHFTFVIMFALLSFHLCDNP